MDNTFIGNIEYYIKFNKGTHEVREVINSDDDYDIVFKGTYENCKKFLDNEEIEYREETIF